MNDEVKTSANLSLLHRSSFIVHRSYLSSLVNCYTIGP